MTAREELERLARKAWPAANAIEVLPLSGRVWTDEDTDCDHGVVVRINHLRATEALHACLLVLANEPDPLRTRLYLFASELTELGMGDAAERLIAVLDGRVS